MRACIEEAGGVRSLRGDVATADEATANPADNDNSVVILSTTTTRASPTTWAARRSARLRLVSPTTRAEPGKLVALYKTIK